MSTAVWMVICKEPEIRAPLRGCLGPYSARVAMRPGISTSAISISLRPQSASERSATWESLASGMRDLLDEWKASAPLAIKSAERNKDIKNSLCHFLAKAGGYQLCECVHGF